MLNFFFFFVYILACELLMHYQLAVLLEPCLVSLMRLLTGLDVRKNSNYLEAKIKHKIHHMRASCEDLKKQMSLESQA